MDKVEELLRRLALNDEGAVDSVLAPDPQGALVPPLDGKTHALVRLGALLAVGAGTTSLRWMTELAYEAGATDEEIASVLVAVSPDVGCAGVVREAPRLALAIGYDLEDVVG
jgi:alkylhydroperoxidase/carboxymuconolactone decarboxylase family protein YurZ